MENSRLGKLPPELRNMIYKFTLSLPFPININYIPEYSRTQQPERWVAEDDRPRNATAITRVCKQLHQETDGMFFTLNDITLGHWEEAQFRTVKALLPAFLRFVGPATKGALSSITLATGPRDYFFEELSSIIKEYFPLTRKLEKQRNELGLKGPIALESRIYMSDDLREPELVVNLTLPVGSSPAEMRRLLRSSIEEAEAIEAREHDALLEPTNKGLKN